MKITVNDVEYDKETFTEEQNAMFNNIVTNRNAIALVSHQLECMNAVGNNLVAQLEASLKEAEASDSAE